MFILEPHSFPTIFMIGGNGDGLVWDSVSRISQTQPSHLCLGMFGNDGEDEHGYYHDYATNIINELEQDHYYVRLDDMYQF